MEVRAKCLREEISPPQPITDYSSAARDRALYNHMYPEYAQCTYLHHSRSGIEPVGTVAQLALAPPWILARVTSAKYDSEANFDPFGHRTTLSRHFVLLST